MAKITFDTKVQGTDASLENEVLDRVFQVVLHLFDFLRKIQFMPQVEIVKVTWGCKEKWPKGQSPLVADFRIVFCPAWSLREKLQVVGRWEIGQKQMWIFFDEERVQLEHPNLAINLKIETNFKVALLKDEEIENLALALIEAIKARTHDFLSSSTDAAAKISSTEASLNSLLKINK